MKKTYDRGGSIMIAVRFPEDVYKLVMKRGRRSEPFCPKAYAALRKLDALEKRCDELGIKHADL